MPVIALDTETFYEKGVMDVRMFGAYAYSRHPDFYCFMISVYDGERSWAGGPEDFDWASLEGADLVSHNAFFDMCVVTSMIEKGQIPAFKWKSWNCTADLTSFLCNRRSLADASAYLYGEKVDKGAREDMNGVHWRNVKDTPQGAEFLKYADGDAVYCWRFWNTHSHLWPEQERRISQLHREAGIRGVQVDTAKLEAYLEGAKKALFGIEQKLPWIAQGEKPTSTKMIAQMCREAGIPGTPVKKTAGEEAFLEWEKTYSPAYPWIAAVSQWRSMNKFLGFLETIQERIDSDGILHFSLKYFGAHTGRLSGDAGVNMQNLRRDPLLIDKDGNLRTDDASYKEYWDCQDRDEIPSWMGTTNWGMTNEDGTPADPIFEHMFDTRSLFVARPGRKFVMCDLSQIEPRVLAWLSGHDRLLGAIRDGYSVYEAAAIATGKYNGPKGGFKKLKDLYKVQKAQTLGLGYGCGWEKYIVVAMSLAGYDVCSLDPVDPETGEKIFGATARRDVREFRDLNPEIASFDKESPGIWAKLDASFQASLGGNYYLELPSGRVLQYRNVRRSSKKKVIKVIDEATGKVTGTKIRDRHIFTAETDGRRHEFYGGHLTENACQACGYDVFGFGLLNAIDNTKAEGVNFVWSVHDEGIFEVPLDFNPSRIEDLMSVTPPWLPGCPVGAEAQEGHCYKK